MGAGEEEPLAQNPNIQPHAMAASQQSQALADSNISSKGAESV